MINHERPRQPRLSNVMKRGSGENLPASSVYGKSHQHDLEGDERFLERRPVTMNAAPGAGN